MDVLDIGDNRIDVMESLTDIVQFRGLISLRVEGNPVCREDAAIVQTLVNEMQGLLVIDGIETSVYSGGRKVMEEETPRSVLREVEMLESKRRRKEQKRLDGLARAKQGSGSGSGSKRPSPPPIKRASSSSPGSLTRSTRTSPSSTRTSPSSKKTSPSSRKMSPSSTSKTSPKTSRLRSSKSSQGSFTLSLASVMSDFDISDDAANGDRKTKKQFSSSSSSSTSTTTTTTTTSSMSNQRPSIVPHLHVTKSSQIGSDYGLSRPMSARGVGSRNRSSGMASPRLSARGRRSEENAPVARASSMRTGRGTGLKVRNVLNSSFFCFEFI